MLAVAFLGITSIILTLGISMIETKIVVVITTKLVHSHRLPVWSCGGSIHPLHTCALTNHLECWLWVSFVNSIMSFIPLFSNAFDCPHRDVYQALFLRKPLRQELSKYTRLFFSMHWAWFRLIPSQSWFFNLFRTRFAFCSILYRTKFRWSCSFRGNVRIRSIKSTISQRAGIFSSSIVT